MATTLGELAVRFGYELIGDPEARVSRVATLANADGESLSFFANRAYHEQLRTTAAAAVIVPTAPANARTFSDCINSVICSI